MSSILDALERASQERPPGESDLIPKGYPEAPRSGFPLLWFLLGLGLVVLLLLGYWLYSGSGSEAPETEARSGRRAPLLSDAPANRVEPVEVKSEPVSATAPPSVDLQARLKDSGAPSQRSLLAEAALSTPSKVAPKPPQTDMRAVADDEQRTPPVVRQATVEPPSKQDSTPESRDTVALSGLPANAAPSIPPPSPLQPERPVPVAPAPPPDDASVSSDIPLIWELPQGLREELEQLKISIHVYHQEPARRFVIINMRRYAEGDDLRTKGYRLKRIDRDGIVVDHGAGLVRLQREKYY